MRRDPEKTYEKILEVSSKLFFEKGYENTSLQDIVNNLDGLTKGAVYHHFSSKDDILDAIEDKLLVENNPRRWIGDSPCFLLQKLILMAVV